MPVALATAAATAGTTFALNKAFGPKDVDERISGARNFQPQGFSGGGLRGASGPGGFTVTSDPVRQGLVGGLRQRFQEQAGLTAGLRGQVAPGISGLREARLSRVRDAERRSIGNLRENLAQRRIAGSSFAEDAVSRSEAEFGRLESDVAGETFLQELDLTNRLIQQEFDLRRQDIQTELNELNLQADVAGKLGAGIDQILARNAQFDAALAFKEAEGAGRFAGQIAQPIGKALGSDATRGFINRGLFGGRNRTGVPTDAGGRVLGGI